MVQGWARRAIASALRKALAACACAPLLVPAAAQASPARPAADAGPLVDIAIPEQPLSSALQAFARQVGKQIVFYSDDALHLRAGPVNGRFSEREALKRLLRNSGLDFIYVNDRTIGIGKRDAQGRFQLSTSPIGARERSDSDAAAVRPIIVTGRLLDAELST